MPTPVMSSVRGESYAEYVIKKSKFIARAVHITTEEEAQAYLRDGKTGMPVITATPTSWG